MNKAQDPTIEVSAYEPVVPPGIPIDGNAVTYIDVWLSLDGNTLQANWANFAPIGIYDCVGVFTGSFPNDEQIKTFADDQNGILLYGKFSTVKADPTIDTEIEYDENKTYWIVYISYDFKLNKYIPEIASVVRNKDDLTGKVTNKTPRKMATAFLDPFINLTLKPFNGSFGVKWCTLEWYNDKPTGKSDYIALCESDPGAEASDYMTGRWRQAEFGSGTYNLWTKWNDDYWMIYCSYCYRDKVYKIMHKVKATPTNSDVSLNELRSQEYPAPITQERWEWHPAMAYLFTENNYIHNLATALSVRVARKTLVGMRNNSGGNPNVFLEALSTYLIELLNPAVRGGAQELALFLDPYILDIYRVIDDIVDNMPANNGLYVIFGPDPDANDETGLLELTGSTYAAESLLIWNHTPGI